MNYSLLVTRSVDFDPFGAVLERSYPDRLQRPLLLSLIQTLWDRGEPNGYAWHMTDDPLPNTPPHKVLQILSFGDHQVANVATEVEARTIGSHIRRRRRPRAGTPTSRPTTDPADRPLPVRRGRRPGGLGHRSAAGRPRHARRRRSTAPPALGVDPHDLVIESEPPVRRQIAEVTCSGSAARLIDVCARRAPAPPPLPERKARRGSRRPAGSLRQLRRLAWAGQSGSCSMETGDISSQGRPGRDAQGRRDHGRRHAEQAKIAEDAGAVR